MAGAESWRLEVTLEPEGAILLDRRLGTIAAGLDDWSDVWPQVAAWFYAVEEEQFKSEGRGRWKPLAPATQRRRARHGFPPSHPILEETGKLAASLMGGEGHVRREKKLSITLGTDLRVGAWNLGRLHEDGTRHMPSRPPIPGGGMRAFGEPAAALEPADAKNLRRIFTEYLHALVTGERA